MKALTPLRKYRAKVFLAPALKLFECLCELAVPFLVAFIIDEGLTEGGAHYHEAPFVLGLSGLVFAFAILGFGLTMISQYLSSDTCTRFSLELRQGIYDHIHSLTPIELEEYGKNRALTLMGNDSFSLQNGVQYFMRLLVRAPFIVLGSIVASFVINWVAGLIVVGALGLSALVIFLVIKLTPKQYGKLQRELDVISARGEDAILGARVIRAFNLEEKQEGEFKQESERYRKVALLLSKINAAINPLTFGLINLAVIVILYFGSYGRSSSGLTTGQIVALLSFLTQSLNALIQFTRLVTSLSKALASKKRIDAFLAIEPSIVDGPLLEEPSIKEGDLYFELRKAGVSFGGQGYGLLDVDMQIHKGEKVGIIGGTGSGKSVLISLLERFRDPSVGSFFYKGHDAKESKVSSIRGDIALVSQKPQLFKGSVADNITLGLPLDRQRLDRALDDSLSSEFVSRMSNGVDTILEERGANLSGGQKQRLMIARALYADRPVLILDDATSALDYKSDSLLRENINRRPGLTLVMVSQRATSIKNCDRIYVLDEGKVVGLGRHEELLSSCPVYRQIYEAQVKRT